MAVIVRIPTPFQYVTGGRETIEANPDSIAGLIAQLDGLYPGISEKLTEKGKIRSYVNILVNDDDIRFLQGEDTAVSDGDEVTIVPAIAGG
jgi:molybdopterin converting factor small subunit